MCKNSTKSNMSYNIIALNAVSEKCSISKQYARQCIKGDRKSISADAIKKEYLELVRKIEKALIS